MLPKNVTNAAAIAIVACVTSAVAHATAITVNFYGSIDGWPAWIEIFAFAAFLVGLGAGIFSYACAPAKPRGWRPAKPWTLGRLAPAAAYVGVLIGSLVIYESAGPGVSALVWKLVAGTAVQFAFALSVWEKWWMWRQFTVSSTAVPRNTST